ncbi:MAG: hypothetical protein QW514_00645 [Thermoprotei archaeon]
MEAGDTVIVYTDLVLAAFVVVLLASSTLALTGTSEAYQQAYTKRVQATLKLYTLFSSCAQVWCAPKLSERSASEGANLSLSASSMVVWFEG